PGRNARNHAYNPGVRVLEPKEKGGQLKTLPVFVSLVFASLAFAADGFAQMPAQGPMQVAQAAGGASQGAVPTASSGGVMSTMVSAIAAAAAAAAALAANASVTAPSHH